MRKVHLVIPALVALAGCQWGSAGFNGTIGTHGFDPNGTVFSYTDAFDDDLNEDQRPRVVVFMTWLIFNPNADLADVDGAELEALKHELRLRDAMALVFDDQTDVVQGATFTSETAAGIETSNDGLQARVHFSPERLTAASTYSDFKPFGSVRNVSVSVTAAGFVEGGATGVSGEIVIDVSTSDTDPSDSLTGRLEGTFQAPLVTERLAEHNLSLLAVDDILGVPLPTRLTAE